MVTKDQAMTRRGREFHYGECKQTIGPRGKVTTKVKTWRANGKCQTWKTKPDEFRLPIKYGLRDFSYLTHSNCSEFHLASECPANPLTKRYPDTSDGAIQALKEMSTHDVSKASAEPDPQVAGVWLVTHPMGRSIVYLAGYKESTGEIREHNDFEDGEIWNPTLKSPK